MAMLYTHSIGYQLYNTMVVFKMRDIVPSRRYSCVCNQMYCIAGESSWLNPTYRVYQFYDNDLERIIIIYKSQALPMNIFNIKYLLNKYFYT